MTLGYKGEGCGSKVTKRGERRQMKVRVDQNVSWESVITSVSMKITDE